MIHVQACHACTATVDLTGSSWEDSTRYNQGRRCVLACSHLAVVANIGDDRKVEEHDDGPCGLKKDKLSIWGASEKGKKRSVEKWRIMRI